MSALSDYLENKLVDAVFRGQALPTLSTMYVGLLTAAPTDAGGGTEVSGNAYQRVGVTSSLANWAGTQGAGTSVASSGASGTTSNNGQILFPTPTPAGWGSVVALGVYDALTGGNLLWYTTLTVPKTINAGDVVDFPAGTLTFQIDT